MLIHNLKKKNMDYQPKMKGYVAWKQYTYVRLEQV